MKQGLMVFGKTQLDNNKIQKIILDEEGYHAEFNVRDGYFFFEEQEDMYDDLERTLDELFAKYDINARFEGIFESMEPTLSITEQDITVGAKFKGNDGTVFIVDDVENDPKFGVIVRCSIEGGKKGNYIDTIKDILVFLNNDMKATKVLESIKNLEFKTFEHYLSLVESSSTDILSSFGGMIQPESEWSTTEDSLLLDKDKKPLEYTLVMVGDRLFKTNHLDLMKANIGKQIRFKYDASELYPMMIEPKLMGQLVKTLNTNESTDTPFIYKSNVDKSFTPRLEMIELLKQKFPNVIINTRLFDENSPNGIWSGAENRSFIDNNKKIPAFNTSGSYSYNPKLNKNYDNEVHNKLASFLKEHGWYTEFYDDATPIFYPIYNTNETTDKAKSFISDKIKKLKEEGRPQKQAVAMAYAYAKKAGYKVNEALNIDELLSKFPNEINVSDDEDAEMYNLALITKTHVYYTDDSDGIKMYDYDMNLVLNGGYLTEQSLIDDILADNFIWASEDMQYNIKEIKKEHSAE